MDDLIPVWNGTLGRLGASLSTYQGKSSLYQSVGFGVDYDSPNKGNRNRTAAACKPKSKDGAVKAHILAGCSRRVTILKTGCSNSTYDRCKREVNQQAFQFES